VEDGRTLGGREAGEFQFLERGRRHGGDLPPVRERLWRHTARLAQGAIWRDVGELQREQPARQFGKLVAGGIAAAFDERAQAAGMPGK
jgi:hypothetical protein